jgi:hypothetical protein
VCRVLSGLARCARWRTGPLDPQRSLSRRALRPPPRQRCPRAGRSPARRG